MIASKMAKGQINVKDLIRLVSERSALWDRTSESYRDRKLKDNSWKEICTCIKQDYDHMSPKLRREFSKMVSKKWTHVRDCWVKSMKNGYDEKTMRPMKPYIYHNELYFLHKMIKCQHRLHLLTKLDENEIDNYLFDDVNSRCQQHENNLNDITDTITNDNDNNNDNHKNNKESQVAIEENSNFSSDTDEDNDWSLENDNSSIDIKEESINEQTVKSEPIFKTRDYFKNGKKRKESTANSINSVELVQKDSITTTTTANIDTTIITTTSTASTGVSLTPTTTTIVSHKLCQNLKRKSIIPNSFDSKNKNFNNNNQEINNENRHWHFFKSILPSVNHLNDIQTLEFQSTVINVLHKLCHQQLEQTNPINGHRLFTHKNHKLSDDSLHFEWTDCSAERPIGRQQQKKNRKQHSYSKRSPQKAPDDRI